ncbi:hypothetical protein NUM3379_35040 [Kineococcus sp. NUM-3379]
MTEDPSPERRRQFGTQVRGDVQDRARAAVRGVRRATGADYSLAAFTEEAMERYAAHLEQLYNNGEPWPVTDRPLPRGR